MSNHTYTLPLGRQFIRTKEGGWLLAIGKGKESTSELALGRVRAYKME